jgi:hypothetical protein
MIMPLSRVKAKNQYTISTAAESRSAAYILPRECNQITMVLTPTTATASVEYTCSGMDEIDAGTARWVAWPKGIVSSSTSDAALNVVAVRLRQIGTGSAKLDLVAS